MKTITTIAVLFLVVASLTAGVIWSGVYNVAADDPHWAPVHAVIDSARKRSIAVRAADLQVPDLADPARIRQGSGNYHAMCMGCHLAPGMAGTEMSRGLYPAPPDLSQDTVDAAEAFWVIKHGIKASGMPAWGGSMGDEYIWNMTAFLQVLPSMDASQYRSMVASSGGHDHGGGETEPHDHAPGVPDDHPHMPAQALPTAGPEPHAHPPGTPAHHDAETDLHTGMVVSSKSESVPLQPPPTPTPETGSHDHAVRNVEALPAPQAVQANDGHDHHH